LQVAKYAQDFFKDRRCPRKFERKRRGLPAAQVFQVEPIKAPLFKLAVQKNEKLAIEAFKGILTYSGAGGAPAQSLKNATSIVRRLLRTSLECEELRDEIFFQLVKQTRKCGDMACCLRTWGLFLIIASVMPSTRNSEREIRDHLIHHARSKTRVISDFAQFTYIRFNARCLIGKPEEDLYSFPSELVERIPKEPFEGHACFGVTIAEQLWHQRVRYPNLPIPLILPTIAEVLLEKGACKAEGVFRLSGLQTTVLSLANSLNEGGDPKALFAHATINDLSQLMKHWFMSLPGKLVTIEQASALHTLFGESKDYVTFAESLPTNEHFTLRWMVGLIQELLRSEDTTKMGVKNFAIVLASPITACPVSQDPTTMLKHNVVAQEFLKVLIEEWDTHDVYPLPPECFAPETE
jgi:hypothetical protein